MASTTIGECTTSASSVNGTRFLSQIEKLVLMTLPTRSPAGRPYEPRSPSAPGQELGGVWRVKAVFGEAPEGEVGRTLAVQPLVTLFEPVP